MMTRFAVDNQLENADKLKTFAVDGYAFDSQLSSELEWVFTR